MAQVYSNGTVKVRKSGFTLISDAYQIYNSGQVIETSVSFSFYLWNLWVVIFSLFSIKILEEEKIDIFGKL